MFNMLELTGTVAKSMCCMVNIIRTISKNPSPKAIIMKKLMKEQKQMFGPVLETKKEKVKRQQKKGKESKVIDLENHNDNNIDGEMKWTAGITNDKNILFVKKYSNNGMNINIYSNHKSVKVLKKNLRSIVSASDSSKITQVKNLTTDGTKVIKAKRKNIKIIKIKNKEATSCDLNTTIDNKSKDLFYSEKDVDNKSVIDSKKILNFPIFIKTENNFDDWTSKEIMSFSPTQPQDYSLPGVTRVLKETMSEEAKLMLEKWKKKLILSLGEEEFNRYCEAQLNDSKMMHSMIERALKKEPFDVPDYLKQSFNSINLVLKDVDNVRMIESHVVHPTLGYRGFIDCIANYRGNLCLIDWKKSLKLKTMSTIYDSPLQISAYIGALNADPNYPFQVKMGLLAIAYSHGQPPSVFEFSAVRLEFYWKEWLKRLDKYHAMHLT